MAARASKRATTGPTFGDVIDVVRDYLSEIVIPIPAIPNVGRRAAFVGLAGSALALLLSEAFFVGPLGRVMLALPFLGIALSAVAAWFATPQVGAELTSVREAELRHRVAAVGEHLTVNCLGAADGFLGSGAGSGGAVYRAFESDADFVFVLGLLERGVEKDGDEAGGAQADDDADLGFAISSRPK